MGPDPNGLTLADYVRVIRQRKWTIFVLAVLCTGAALAYTARAGRQYAATAQVFVQRQNLAAILTGADDGSTKGDPDRFVQTQRVLAKAPIVAERTLNSLGIRDLTPRTLLGHVTVTASGTADILRIEVTASGRLLAARLATEYARQFVAYRRDLDTSALEGARKGLEASIGKLRESKNQNQQLFADLVSKDEQLRTMEALQTGDASVFKPADDAEQVSPKPVRNLALGVLLGLILGLVAAFVRHAGDSRVRSADTGHALSDLPQLARLPTPPRKLRAASQLAMVAEPDGDDAEGSRVLRAAFESVVEKIGATSVMVTSALPGEGKSTTVANLAVALACAGRSVILVDFDLRRPSQHQFFRVREWPGITDVLLGEAELEAVLAPVDISELRPKDLRVTSDGTLSIVAAGTMHESVGDLVASPSVLRLLDALRSRADFVLVDAPALLVGGDAITLSAGVDGLLFVLRLNVTRRPAIDDVQQVLGNCHAPPLGYVVTGADRQSSYGYGRYGYRGRTKVADALSFGAIGAGTGIRELAEAIGPGRVAGGVAIGDEEESR
jgi:succinoglycan biosynthesis transport protein ExoP